MEPRQVDPPKPGFVPLRLTLEPPAEHGETGESVWAEPLGDERFRIEGMPMLAHGYGYGDVVAADRRDGLLCVREVLERSGHSTYHLQVSAALLTEFHQMYWKPFERIGCTFEGRMCPAEGSEQNRFLVAVDVPPELDHEQVHGLLEKGRQRGIWTYEVAHESAPC
jgi:hypothetical protein